MKIPVLDPVLAPAMFTRKSIRKFAAEGLKSEQVEAARARLTALAPLFPGQPAQLELTPDAKAPVWRVDAFGDDSLLGNINIGFMLQQLDLRLHQMGLGSLWFGMGLGLAPRGIAAGEGLRYILRLKIGVPDEPLARGNAGEFDRKPFAEICDDGAFAQPLEGLRLAPSAMNAQPWFLQKQADGYVLFCQKTNALLPQHIDRMHQVDIGIGLAHFALALPGWDLSTETGGAARKGYYAVATLRPPA